MTGGYPEHEVIRQSGHYWPLIAKLELLSVPMNLYLHPVGYRICSMMQE